MAHPVVLLVFWTALLLALSLADWRMGRYEMHWSFYYEKLSAQDAELFRETIGLPKELGPNPNWYKTEQQITQKLKELDRGLSGRSVAEFLNEKGQGALAGRYADHVWRGDLILFLSVEGMIVYSALLIPLCAWIVHRILDNQGRSYQQTLAVYIIWWTFWAPSNYIVDLLYFPDSYDILISRVGLIMATLVLFAFLTLWIVLELSHCSWIYTVSHGAGLGRSVYAVSVAMIFFMSAFIPPMLMFFYLNF